MSHDPVRIPAQGGPLEPSARPAVDGQPAPGARGTAPARQAKQAAAAPKDAKREIIETIVFVVVLVLLLKSFVAEAFVIPTGSMATTLLVYQHWADCPKCHVQ